MIYLSPHFATCYTVKYFVSIGTEEESKKAQDDSQEFINHRQWLCFGRCWYRWPWWNYRRWKHLVESWWPSLQRNPSIKRRRRALFTYQGIWFILIIYKTYLQAYFINKQIFKNFRLIFQKTKYANQFMDHWLSLMSLSLSSIKSNSSGG